MSAYANDPRVRQDPYVPHSRLVKIDSLHIEITVTEGDDGLWRAFADEPRPGAGRRFGPPIDHIPAGDLDSVIRELIGDPQ